MTEKTANGRARHVILTFWKKKVPVPVVVVIVGVVLMPEVFRHFHLRQLDQTTGSDKQPLGIEDLVRKVKTELVAAEEQMRTKGEISLFELESFEMELNFVVREESSSKAGAHTELVTAESEIQAGSEKVQKLTLHWRAATVDASNSPSTQVIAPGEVLGAKPPSKKGRQP